MTQYTPPPFVERFQYKNCTQVNDPVTRKRVYLTPDGESLPSVTTILSATKDMTALNEWKKRIGEQSLYFPGLYSGTTDLVAVYKDNPSVCDYKQTNKPKKEEWVDDYKLQLVAYILAHNEVYGTDIREGHVFMCSRNCEYQQFDLWPSDFNKYQDLWLNKVEEYYMLNG